MKGVEGKLNKPKVSILVPVYNSQKYLRECLDSVVNHTLKEIQIICIDDGSTDSSPDILAEYASKDDRIEIITKENSGYGASMNRGLDAARGEYIGIVESDDFAEPDMFQKYYTIAARKRLDIVKSNYFEHSSGQGDNKIREYGRRAMLWGTFDPSARPNVILFNPLIWSAIYRRQMLEDSNIRFLETPGASYQDSSFVHRCWFAADVVKFLPSAYLHYRVDNEASSVKSSAKVYAICDEYAESERFLTEHPDKWVVFAPYLEVSKYNTYRWNYNRIAACYREDFAKRWAQDLSVGLQRGSIERKLFKKEDWNQIQVIMKDPVKFAQDHIDGNLPLY